MAFALIYAGEHYFWDIVLGWTYTIVTLSSGAHSCRCVS